jgi:hypothetical protein
VSCNTTDVYQDLLSVLLVTMARVQSMGCVRALSHDKAHLAWFSFRNVKQMYYGL